MKSHISLTSVLAAVMLFAVAVVMHEAARADSFVPQSFAQQADR